MQAKPFHGHENETVTRQYSTSEELVLDALSILGKDAATLVAAVVGDATSAEIIQTVLANIPTDWDENSHRQQLINDDPARYHSYCDQALHLLESALSNDAKAEPRLIKIAQHWGNQLLVEDLARFAELVDRLKSQELRGEMGQQLRDYFAAALLARSAEFDAALSALNALLTNPTIKPYIHARSLNARAICQRVLGHPEAAMDDYDACLTLWRELGDRHYEAVTLQNIATLANGSLQQPRRCVEALQAAAAIFTELDDQGWLAGVHNNLGIVHHDLGEWETALRYLNLSLERRRFEGADEQAAASLLNIAEIRLYQGDLEEAQSAFNEALPHLSKRLYQIDGQVGLGLVLQAQGSLSEAQSRYECALALAIEIGRNEILPLVHYRLADLLRQLTDDEAAYRHLKDAIDLIEQTRTPLRAEEIKISLLGRWQQVYEALILLCVENGRDTEAFAWAERARARAYAEGIEGVSAETIALTELQKTLPADHLLLNYFTIGVVERDIPLLKNLPRNNPLREHLLLPPKIIRFDISQADYAATICPLDPNALTSGSARVHDGQRFLEPRIGGVLAKALLPDGVRSGNSDSGATVIPHGPLHHVPFAALFEQVPALSFAPSATIFARQSGVVSAETGCLAIAYNGSGERGDVLQFAEREADLVADLIGGSTVSASLSLREGAANKRYLHFACHGWFDYERPLDSYLEIADGVHLTAHEIMDEWSLSAELVTLSACQTGISQVLRSDEPMGLIRAFLYAGAQAVLVTQWSVEDLPTFLFMREFYRRVENEKGKSRKLAIILRDVQMWLKELNSAEINSICTDLNISPSPPLPVSDAPFSHPRHWAAFTLIG